MRAGGVSIVHGQKNDTLDPCRRIRARRVKGLAEWPREFDLY